MLGLFDGGDTSFTYQDAVLHKLGADLCSQLRNAGDLADYIEAEKGV